MPLILAAICCLTQPASSCAKKTLQPRWAISSQVVSTLYMYLIQNTTSVCTSVHASIQTTGLLHRWKTCANRRQLKTLLGQVWWHLHQHLNSKNWAMALSQQIWLSNFVWITLTALKRIQAMVTQGTVSKFRAAALLLWTKYRPKMPSILSKWCQIHTMVSLNTRTAASRMLLKSPTFRQNA